MVAANPLLLGLLLLTLVLKTLPGGYMLVASDDGWPQLALCPGTAVPPPELSSGVQPPDHHVQALVHHAAMPGQHPHDPGPAKPSQRADMPCPFAALAAPALPPSPPAVGAAVAPAAAAPIAALAPSSPSLTLASPPPPATGPPHSV